FDSIAASTGGSVTLTGGGDPVLLRAARVSAGYFDVFGVKAAIGRTFSPGGDGPGKDHVLLVSPRVGASQFGGSPALAGRGITLDGEPFTVVGVMAEGSVFDRTFNRMWRPLAFAPRERTRNFHWLVVTGRLKDGVNVEQARAEMDTIGARIARDYPDSN